MLLGVSLLPAASWGADSSGLGVSGFTSPVAGGRGAALLAAGSVGGWEALPRNGAFEPCAASICFTCPIQNSVCWRMNFATSWACCSASTICSTGGSVLATPTGSGNTDPCMTAATAAVAAIGACRSESPSEAKAMVAGSGDTNVGADEAEAGTAEGTTLAAWDPRGTCACEGDGEASVTGALDACADAAPHDNELS